MESALHCLHVRQHRHCCCPCQLPADVLKTQCSLAFSGPLTTALSSWLLNTTGMAYPPDLWHGRCCNRHVAADQGGTPVLLMTKFPSHSLDLTSAPLYIRLFTASENAIRSSLHRCSQSLANGKHLLRVMADIPGLICPGMGWFRCKLPL